MKTPKHTPWGPAHSEDIIAEGITHYTTASHGGIHLSDARWDAFQQTFLGYQPFAGENWFEEDCDARLIALAFPEHYDDECLFHAWRMVRAEHFTRDVLNRTILNKWMASPVSAIVRARASAFGLSVQDKWEVCGCSTRGEGWYVTLQRNKERRVVELYNYPAQCYFTDAELSALAITQSVAA